jgi:CHASE2 domain-containing sensor protein
MNPWNGMKKFFHPVLEGDWKEFGRHYRRALGWIVALTCLIYALGTSGMLKGFDAAALDTFLRVPSREASNNVTIVEIGDKDYREMFLNRSPLCRDRLLQLVARVRSYKPAVIGVDVDTSDPVDPSDARQWCGGDEKSAFAQLAEGRMSPVIWAEVPSNAEAPFEVTQVLSEKDKDSEAVGKLKDLLPPRSRKNVARPEDFVGIPRFPIDSDGLVRRYESGFDVAGASELGDPDAPSSSHLPSLARALVDDSDFCSNPPPREDSNARVKCPIAEATEEAVFFNFYGDRYRFPLIDAGQFRESYEELKTKNSERAETRKTLLQDKIVLIGGTYKAAREMYPTPLGQMAGVELNALAVQSDLSGGGIRKEQEWESILADIAFGSLVVVVFFVWAKRPRRASAIALFGLSAGAILLSVVLFNTSSYFFNFIPIVLGMVLHQTIELAHQAGHLREEVDAKKRDIRVLQREKQVLSDELVLTNLLWESRERDRERDRQVKTRARGAGG